MIGEGRILVFFVSEGMNTSGDEIRCNAAKRRCTWLLYAWSTRFARQVGSGKRPMLRYSAPFCYSRPFSFPCCPSLLIHRHAWNNLRFLVEFSAACHMYIYIFLFFRITALDACGNYGYAGTHGGLLYVWELSSGRKVTGTQCFNSKWCVTLSWMFDVML